MSDIESVGDTLPRKSDEELREASRAAAAGEHPGYGDWLKSQLGAHKEACERRNTDLERKEDYSQSLPMLYHGMTPKDSHGELAGVHERRIITRSAAHDKRVEAGKAQGAYNPRESTTRLRIEHIDWGAGRQTRRTDNFGRNRVHIRLPVTVSEMVRFGELSEKAQTAINTSRQENGLDPLSPALKGENNTPPDVVFQQYRVILNDPPMNTVKQVKVTAEGRDMRNHYTLGQSQTFVSPEDARKHADDNDWIPLTGSKSLEAYHKEKGPVPGTDQTRPDPTLKEVLGDSSLSEELRESALSEARMRAVAANSHLELDGTINLRDEALAVIHHKAAGTPNQQELAMDQTGEKTFESKPAIELPVDAQGNMLPAGRYPASGRGDNFVDCNRQVTHIAPRQRDAEQQYLMEKGRERAAEQRGAGVSR